MEHRDPTSKGREERKSGRGRGKESKAHVTRDSNSPVTLAISVQDVMHLEKALEFEALVWKTP